MVVTTMYNMKSENAHRGLVTMCIGGGQGMAAVLER
jgi:acetyl-CoA C-acetyltransferase